MPVLCQAEPGSRPACQARRSTCSLFSWLQQQRHVSGHHLARWLSLNLLAEYQYRRRWQAGVEVQELLKFKMDWGRPYVLVRWAGHDAPGGTREPLDNLRLSSD